MTRFAFIFVLSALALWPNPAQAQLGFGLGYASSQWFSPGGYGGYGYGGGFASTPAQGYLQGMSSLVRAEGQAEEMRSAAAINYQQAQGAYIDNQQKWVAAYQQARKESRERLEEEAQRDNEKREKYLANRQSGYPPRLTPSQLDPATGHIAWPTVLKAPRFAEGRRKIEELILLRTFTSTSEDLYAQLHAAARDMQADLKSIIRDVPASEYLDGRKFLDSMAYEGRYLYGNSEVTTK